MVEELEALLDFPFDEAVIEFTSEDLDTWTFQSFLEMIQANMAELEDCSDITEEDDDEDDDEEEEEEDDDQEEDGD